MLFVESHAIGFVSRYCGVGARDECAAYGDLGRKAYDGGGDMGFNKLRDGVMDIAWVGREKGAKDKEYFPCAM